ncbi:hypothetical protein STA3757_08310 [Stanieria sp. NIES-3757]|nr:hypothetical protein STA3757_08310 [Stanieria sp. NIES-3757]
MVQQMPGKSNTGTANEEYNLISVLYHALQSASVCDTYMQDAEQAGDRELTEFFQQLKEQNREQAERAKQLMAQRIGR